MAWAADFISTFTETLACTVDTSIVVGSNITQCWAYDAINNNFVEFHADLLQPAPNNAVGAINWYSNSTSQFSGSLSLPCPLDPLVTIGPHGAIERLLVSVFA